MFILFYTFSIAYIYRVAQKIFYVKHFLAIFYVYINFVLFAQKNNFVDFVQF